MLKHTRKPNVKLTKLSFKLLLDDYLNIDQHFDFT